MANTCPECGEPLSFGNDAGSDWQDKWFVTCPNGCHRVEGLTVEEALECVRDNEEEEDG